MSEKNIPFKVETWEPDADGFAPTLCTDCGTPVRYGSRHGHCTPEQQAARKRLIMENLDDEPGCLGAGIGRTQPVEPVFGIVDPDYARAFTIIRCTAWGYGYSALMHGSFTRDLDVLLVPWTDWAAASFESLMKTIAWRTGLTLKGDAPVEKPHGRLAWSLLFPAEGDPRWVDISFFPPKTAAAA